MPRYLDAGFPFVTHLPMATTPAWRRPLELSDEEDARYGGPVSFVGASLVFDNEMDLRGVEATLRRRLEAAGSAAERDRWTRAMEVLRDALRAQQANLLRPVLIEVLEAGWEAIGLTPELEVDGRLLDLRILFGRAFGSRRRSLVLSSLADFGVVVYGDPAWRGILAPGVEFRGAAEHGEELSRIYNASRINLDIGRLYQLDIVTMRVFDILACGGFALVEHSAELPELLEPGREVESYRDIVELRESVAYFLSRPRERRDRVEAGRARVLREHTVAHRLETMLELLRRRGALWRGT